MSTSLLRDFLFHSLTGRRYQKIKICGHVRNLNCFSFREKKMLKVLKRINISFGRISFLLFVFSQIVRFRPFWIYWYASSTNNKKKNYFFVSVRFCCKGEGVRTLRTCPLRFFFTASLVETNKREFIYKNKETEQQTKKNYRKIMLLKIIYIFK